jgi:hypothetical protein
MMNKARKEYAQKGKIKKWCPPTVWNQLLAIWAKSDFKDIQEQNKKNRASTKGGVLHTSGRVSHSEIALQAVCILILKLISKFSHNLMESIYIKLCL